MKSIRAQAGILLLALAASTTAVADNNFGVGVKAGTLGIGLEGTWRPLPYLDLRLGGNTYDYQFDGSKSGINYDATLALNTYYVSGNINFPLSPFRLSGAVYSNGNELQLRSAETGNVQIGDITYTPAEIGTLTSTTSFAGTAPYLGIGFDFTLFTKLGLNLDMGVLWQGEPQVAMSSDGLLADNPAFQAELERERLELEDDLNNFKAWPVVSLGFVYNF
jgi:hypothetical protein